MNDIERELKMAELVAERDDNIQIITRAKVALQSAKGLPDPGDLKNTVSYLTEELRQRNFKIVDEINSL